MSKPKDWKTPLVCQDACPETLKEQQLASLLQQQAELEAFKAMLDKGIEDSKNGLGRPADEFFDELLAEITGRPEQTVRPR